MTTNNMTYDKKPKTLSKTGSTHNKNGSTHLWLLNCGGFIPVLACCGKMSVWQHKQCLVAQHNTQVHTQANAFLEITEFIFNVLRRKFLMRFRHRDELNPMVSEK